MDENQPRHDEPDREPGTAHDAGVTQPVHVPVATAPPAFPWRDWRVMVPAVVVAGGLVLGGGIGGFIVGHATADRDGFSDMRPGGPFGVDHPRGPFGPDGPGGFRGPADSDPADGPDSGPADGPGT